MDFEEFGMIRTGDIQIDDVGGKVGQGTFVELQGWGMGMVEGTLLATANRSGLTATHIAVGIGWDLTMLATVYLANRLTRSLRRQNRRIRKMTRFLRQHQELMIQQEKMVAMGQMAAG